MSIYSEYSKIAKNLKQDMDKLQKDQDPFEITEQSWNKIMKILQIGPNFYPMNNLFYSSDQYKIEHIDHSKLAKVIKSGFDLINNVKLKKSKNKTKDISSIQKIIFGLNSYIRDINH